MKKLLCLLLALLLLPLAQAEAALQPLQMKELTDLAAHYHALALSSDPIADTALTDDGYAFVYEFAVLYADEPTLTAKTALTKLVITDYATEGPRGLHVEDDLSRVLAAFPADHADLRGSYTGATLYRQDALPESCHYAEVQRDGQRVQSIRFAAHERTQGGYTGVGLLLHMAENAIAAMEIYGLTDTVSAGEIEAALSTLPTETDYAQAPYSHDGASLEKFGLADLAFSGVDFLHGTPEDVMAALGEPDSDTWMDDGEYGHIRTLVYPMCEWTYSYDVNKQNPAAYMLMITADGFEGPRAVRIGDSFASVFNRFCNEDGGYVEEFSVELLYLTEDGSFGMVDYSSGLSLTYCIMLEGSEVLLTLNFDALMLTEIWLYVE